MQMVVLRIRKVRDINDTVENFPRSLALFTGWKIKSRIYFTSTVHFIARSISLYTDRAIKKQGNKKSCFYLFFFFFFLIVANVWNGITGMYKWCGVEKERKFQGRNPVYRVTRDQWKFYRLSLSSFLFDLLLSSNLFTASMSSRCRRYRFTFSTIIFIIQFYFLHIYIYISSFLYHFFKFNVSKILINAKKKIGTIKRVFMLPRDSRKRIFKNIGKEWKIKLSNLTCEMSFTSFYLPITTFVNAVRIGFSYKYSWFFFFFFLGGGSVSAIFFSNTLF